MCKFWRNMCTNQDISNIPFIMRGNHCLVHGHKKDLPRITCIFHLFKYVVRHIFSVSDISLLRLLPKSYFKISSFKIIFCALAPLTILDFTVHVYRALHKQNINVYQFKYATTFWLLSYLRIKLSHYWNAGDIETLSWIVQQHSIEKWSS